MSFTDILGHQDVKERLARVVQADRLGSAYLFLGPEGVGRKLAAIAWAGLINCAELSDAYPFACGKCRACRMTKLRQYPDLFVIESEDGKDLKIESIRELLKESHFRPYEGKRRVFIIDNADAMTAGAANALLKTLEEPSPTMMLILIAAREGRILPTIRSRCQSVRFGTLPLDTIAEELVRLGGTEPESRWLAYQASGSLGRAVQLQGDLENHLALRKELFTALGQRHRDPLLGFRMAERYKNPEVVGSILHLLKGFYRDAVVLKSGSRESVVNADHMGLVESEAAAAELPDLIDRFAFVEDAERRIMEIHANKQLVLEQLFQDLAA